MSMKAAVIFDVDGPLLKLTPAEEAAFFIPFRDVYGVSGLSVDWDSYKIRNDIEIYREILQVHGFSDDDVTINTLRTRYLTELERLYSGANPVVPIPQALDLLKTLNRIGGLALGTATANFEAAAKMRLTHAGMWEYIKIWHCGAEGGGAKSAILKRVLKRLALPAKSVIFLGNNLNDLEAAQKNGTHFIGFDVDPQRRKKLHDAGADRTTGDHNSTLSMITEILNTQ